MTSENRWGAASSTVLASLRVRLQAELRRGGRGAAVVLATTLLGLLVGAAAAHVGVKTYAATAQVFVSAASVDSASGLYQSGQFTQSRVQSYIDVVDSPLVLDRARADLALPEDGGALAQQISADAPLDKTLINVVVTDPDPERAADVANAVAEAFIEELPRIETEQTAASADEGLQSFSPLKLTIIQPAVAADAPTGVPPRLLLAVGGTGGLVLGLAALLLLHRTSPALARADDLTPFTGDVPLTAVQWAPAPERTAAALLAGGDGPLAESVRRMRIELAALQDDTAAPVRIAVASVQPGSGATLVSLGLAASFAQAGYATLLVDSSMSPPRAPGASVTDLAGLVEHPGLRSLATAAPTGAAKGAVTAGVAPVSVQDGLDVLPSGSAGEGSPPLRVTRALRAHLAAVGPERDVVVLDAGAVLGAADVTQVLAQADLAVLVAAARSTSGGALAQALEECRRAGVPVAAVVLNRC